MTYYETINLKIDLKLINVGYGYFRLMCFRPALDLRTSLNFLNFILARFSMFLQKKGHRTFFSAEKSQKSDYVQKIIISKTHLSVPSVIL
jgi:hypothetical protein